MVGFWEDAKTVKAWAGGLMTSLVFRFEQVRDWLVDRATYLFALEQIGSYGPWLSGACMLFVIVKGAYTRGLPAIQEADGIEAVGGVGGAVPGQLATTPQLARSSDEELFASWADEGVEIISFCAHAEHYSDYNRVEGDVMLYAFIDKLASVGVHFPTDFENPGWRQEASALVGLMKNGSLEKARHIFSADGNDA